MRRRISTAGAAIGAIAVAAALAGCGGAGNVYGTATATTSGVAGAQTTKGHATGGAAFRAQVQGFELRLQGAVKAFKSGNLSGAAKAGGPLLTNCQNVVQTKLATRARTTAQQAAVSHLRTACQDMANASAKGAAGDLSAARSLAQQALTEAQAAVKQLGS